MAVKRTLEAIKNRKQEKKAAKIAEKSDDEEEAKPEPVKLDTKKRQPENNFVPESTSDAKTFVRDLKNLEQLNSKFKRPLEAERQKELADRKVKEEWDKAMIEEKQEKEK